MTLIRNDQLEIHASELPKWARCEKQRLERLFNPPPSKEYKEHIATWVGSAVHATVAGELWPDKPTEVVFDKLTPTWKIASWQVKKMSKAAMDILKDEMGTEVEYWREYTFNSYNDYDWPMNMRLVGTADIVFRTRDDRGYGIIDTKTGVHFEKAWLQLGAYKLLFDNQSITLGLKHLGVLHCPRPEPGQEVNAVLEWSDAPEKCVEEAMILLYRIGKLASHSQNPIAAPGVSCKWCSHPSCAVRQHSSHII